MLQTEVESNKYGFWGSHGDDYEYQWLQEYDSP
jgi:hypothetical protein